MNDAIKSAVHSMVKDDENSLYAKLGGYAAAFPGDPAAFSSPGADVQIDASVAGHLDDAINLGKRVFARWQKSLYDLVCGTDGVDPEARKTIDEAIKLNSPAALAAAITSILIGVFSVGPAIAAVVGVLFGRILLPDAGREICSFWKERL